MLISVKKYLLVISALIVIGLIAMVISLQLYVTTPKFRIENISTDTVQVTAYWRDKSKEIGELKTGSIVMFEINDEAAMSFEVVYPDGTVKNTTAVYFTSGTTVYVQINSKGIDVSAGT